MVSISNVTWLRPIIKFRLSSSRHMAMRRRAAVPSMAAQWITCSNHSAKKRYSMQSTQLSLRRMEGSNGGLLKFDKGGETNMLETIGSGGSNQEPAASVPDEDKKPVPKTDNRTSSKAKPRVYVVDDDVSVREAVGSLIRSAGLRVETLASAQEFLASPRADVPSCLVLDVQLPGLSGLDLQQELVKANVQIP